MSCDYAILRNAQERPEMENSHINWNPFPYLIFTNPSNLTRSPLLNLSLPLGYFSFLTFASLRYIYFFSLL